MREESFEVIKIIFKIKSRNIVSFITFLFSFGFRRNHLFCKDFFYQIKLLVVYFNRLNIHEVKIFVIRDLQAWLRSSMRSMSSFTSCRLFLVNARLHRLLSFFLLFLFIRVILLRQIGSSNNTFTCNRCICVSYNNR